MNKRPFYYPVGHSLNRLALAILLTISTLFTHSLFAQTCDSTFIKRIGSYGMTEQGRKIVPLQDGNLLIGGNKDNASLLLKITPQGEVIWERVFDLSPTADYFYEMIIDSEGMLVLVGRYAMNSNTVSFIMRYDYQNDMVLWTVKIPDPSSVRLDGILEKTDGNYIAFGTTNYYKLIIEVDKTDGSLKWDRSYNTGNPDAFRDAILIDSAIYTANIQRYGTVLSKTRPGVSKLNLDGSQVWTRNYLKSLSAVATIHATNIASVNDTLAILGYGNLTYVEPYPYKIQFFTTDLDGNLHWAKQYDLPGNYQYSKDLIALPDGYLLLAEITQYFATELLVMKIDKEGQKVWAKTIGGPYHESAWSFAVMGEYLVIVGNTKSFDEEGDIILCKIALDGSAVGDECTIVADAVINTTNIASPYSGQHLMQPKTYNYTLTTETLASSISPASPNTDMPGCGCIPYLCNILIENPGFENGLTGWNITGEVAISPDAPTGTKAVEICGLDDGSVGQIYPAQQGESFTASVWGKITDPDYAAAINLRFLDGSFTPLTAGEDRQLIKSHVYEQYFMKATAPPGTAYVHFLAWKERDNCAYFDDVRLCKDGDPIFFPDLTVEGLSIPNNPVLQGSSLSVEYTISNIGTATTSIGFNVDFYISTSNTLDQNSILLASYTQQPYAIGATANLTSNPILPNSLQPGNYYLIAIVDKSQTIIELDEGNNKISFPFSVDAPGLCDGTITLTSQAEVDAFPNCPTINGDLVISGNDITDLTLLSTLVEITGALAIQNNASLATLAGLENVMQANILIVQNNPLLNSLSPLSNLTKASMTTLAIENNDQLVSLTGLEGISGVGQIRINYNDNLLNLDGLQNLSTITGQFLISGNANLNNINALSQISAVGSDLLVLNNDKLGNLSGLSQLANIGRDLIVVGANALVNLDGLQNLIAVGEELVFQDNALLENLDGLASLTSTQSLIVQDNANLAACCAVFPLLNAGTISGSITIENNLPGCNSEQEIEDTCTPVGSYIDLELHLAQPNESPAQWTSYATTATLTNNGDAPATGIQVSFAKPAGVVYTGGNEYTASQGSFNPNGSEVWTVSSLAPGQSATLTVNYFLLQNTLPTAYAQVTAANEDDVDSTPNNGTPPSVNEDDEASTAPPTNGPIICSGGVILESQAEVDAFQGCEIIEGQLTIRSPFGTNGASSDITDLTPLLSITKVTGVIVIQNNDSLFNLTGLDNITSSNGIVVQSCENINSIQALSGISGEVNVIKISGNPSLTNIDGLEGITKTHNTAEIDNNSTLQNLNGLSGLVEVNDVHLFIHTNPLLTDIQGLSNLTHINTDLIIGNCDGLENLNGLHNLVYAKSFILAGNDLLTDVSAVTLLTDVDITFFVANNPLLSDCCIFTDLLNNNNIVSITIENNAPGCNSEQDIESSCGPKICTGDVILESQAEVDAFSGCSIIDGNLFIRSPYGIDGASSDITDLSPLSSVIEVRGEISIDNNDQLIDLHGLENVTTINTSLVIRNCENLTSVQALSGYSGELNYLVIWNNQSLTNIDGLNGITSINNGLSIVENTVLQNLNGLSNITEVNGTDLLLSKNLSLTDIQGLSNLTHVNTDLIIVNCDALENLQGLNNLTTAGSFILSSNDVLNDVSAVTSLTHVDHTFFVGLNPMLSDCCIFEDLLKNNAIGGTITIENNAPGCNSEQDIETSCGPVICTGDVILESQAEVDAFPGCEIIEGQLVIEGGDISDLTPLSSLKEIRKVLVIRNNSNLLTLNGLNNLTTIGGLAVVNNPLLQNLLPLSKVSSDDLSPLVFQKNKAMIDLKGLEGITGVQYLSISENSNLTTLEGLNNLAIGKSDFLVSQNPALENLNGLNSLHTTKDVTGIHNNDALADISALSQLNSVFVLAINSNSSLTNLSGLENLSDVWTIAITGNDALENLDAFSSLTAITGDLTIIDNPALSDCCGIQPLLNGGGIAGNILIENNPFACGSGFDIINNCGPSGVDLELSMSQPNAAPAQWTTYPVTLTLSNTGDSPATGIVVHFPKPDGVVYAGGNEFSTSQGTFNPFGNQEWVVGKLKEGGTVTLQVNYFLLQSDAPVAYAQVSAVNEEDIDSSPNNGTPPSANEDDEANSVDPSVSSACSGDIVLNSQAEVNAFGNCEIIDGNLMIVGDDIIDLTPLSSLKEVKGNLNIWNNGNLTNLEGLNNLFSVGGLTLRSNPHLENLLPLSNLSGDKLIHLVISKNKELLDLKGLEGITGLEQLFIEGNTYLTTLEGLDNLVVAEGNITIWRNSSLLNLNALANLQSVGAAFTIEQNDKLSDLSALANLGPCRDLHVLTNASLLDLSGLENLSGLRDLTIAQNNGLKNLDAFSSLTSISGELTVRGNPVLTDCCGIQPLLSSGDIGGPINIYFNPFSCNNEQNILDNCTATVCTGDVILSSQAEVDAFQGCEIIEGNLYIHSPNGVTGASSDITDLSPLLGLTQINGYLSIINNKELVDLNGLENLTSVFYLQIRSCDNLNSIQALSGISGELGSLVLWDNPSLSNMDGLNGITGVSGVLSLLRNNAFKNLDALSNLTYVNYDLTIDQHSLLTNIQGLSNLSSIGHDLKIANCNVLQSLNGLNNITSLNSLTLSGNQLLQDVSGLNTLTSISDKMQVKNNPMLSDCCIFDDLLKSNSIGGTITFENNAPGCNSEQDIESSCGPVICTGDVILETQAEVDAFPGCEIIEGDLVIRPPNGVAGASSDITDLSALAGVVKVTGALALENNDLLLNLQGLNALTSVGDGLAIVECANLTSIQALSGISGELGNISILGNASLVNLDGLEGINKAKRNLSVENNAALQNLNGLSNVDSVSTLGYSHPLYIFRNPSLVNIQGLQSLEYVGGLMTIVGCDTLENLNGLENLNTVGGPFVLAENYQLYDASALGNLSSVGGSLTVSGNPLLSDCCIFTDLINNNGINGSIDIQSNAPGCNSEQDIESSCGPVICGDIYLETQADVDAFPGCTIIDGILSIQPPVNSGITSDITDLSPLLSVTEVTGSVIVAIQKHLKDLHGLENITSAGRLVLAGCDSLETIEELANLQSELKDVFIFTNPLLSNLHGLESIKTTNCYISIDGNDALQNLDAFSNIETAGRIEILRNSSLNDIQGLGNLTTVNDDFIIFDCDALQNLNGLEKLTSVGGLALTYNETISNIDAIANLESVGDLFSVAVNPMLSDCCIFSELINNNAIGGPIGIQNNAPGCNSEQDIYDFCQPQGIDLELSMTATNLNPAIYTSSPVTLTLSNEGTEPATGVKVSFPKPDGTVYTGGNEWTATQGTFNPFTNEEWTVGDLPAGGSVTLTVSYFLLTANTLSPYAQVVAHNETDIDSSPGNGTSPTVNEDDEATILLNGFTGNGGGISLKNHNERFRLIFDNIFPNPAKYLITMDIFSRFDQTVLLDFYDVTGRSIHRMEVLLEEGQNKVELDVSEWRSGTYNVIGRGDGLPAYGRFLKIWEE